MSKLGDMLRKITAPREDLPSSPRDPWESPTGTEILGRMYSSNPALAAEVERGRARRQHTPEDAPTPHRETPQPDGPLHAHEVTPADAALMRMLAGAHFSDGATVTLPSGKTITGAEMRWWVEAQG